MSSPLPSTQNSKYYWKSYVKYLQMDMYFAFCLNFNNSLPIIMNFLQMKRYTHTHNEV